MPKKKQSNQPQEQEEPQGQELRSEEAPFRQVQYSLVTGNPTLRLLGQTLQNGTRYAKSPHVHFMAHYSLLQELERAYVHMDEEAFLSVLKTYLEEAGKHIGQVAPPSLVEELRPLFLHPSMGGMETIGRYLLVLAKAPVDTF